MNLGNGRAWAQDGQTKAIIRITDEIDIDPVGNATGESEIVLPQEIYNKVKTLMSSRETVQENGQPVTKRRESRMCSRGKRSSIRFTPSSTAGSPS